MSLSKEWTDWHLTPRGWEEGSTEVDFGHVTEKDPPPDRVLTSRFSEELSSAYSKMSRWHNERWRSPDEGAVKALLEKFGPPPSSL
ncbi:MAG: hypothetical protein ACJ71Q_17320 [Terriglobales bacterium]